MQHMARLRGLKDAVLWPLFSVGSMYCRAAERNPFMVGVVTTGLKTSAADLFAQKVMEKREKIDWTRQAAFTFFGFAYLGAFQYYFYTNVLNVIARPITNTMGHIASAPFKTFIDQALHHPFLYFPSFYALKYVVVKGEEPQVAYNRYQDELWSNCTALWTIWVPAQILNFSVVPSHLQIPYVAAVSFVWTVVLSTMRGAFDDKKDILENVDHIKTDEQGIPDLHHHSALPEIASSVMIPSVLERLSMVANDLQRQEERGPAVALGGEESRRMDGRALAATAACGCTGILALQHPLGGDSLRAVDICGWENMLLRLRRR